MASSAGWRFDNSYARLPEAFFARLNPVPVKAPTMVVFNGPLAESLGLNAAELRDAAAIFSGNVIPPGAEPIAQAYAGHQFGYLNRLGDGRAILLGEQVTPEGTRFDVQLKGSGPTPYSRRGDGRAARGPMLREYIISEAMHALGIPTTRSLAVVATGEPVFRETALTGAVLTRVASSHIRVGTFVYAAQLGPVALRALADYTIHRHYPGLTVEAFLRAVIERQASLVARWMLVGFVHGVMNTDNVAISGETIDYGPCAFMDHFSPTTVFSSIDRDGRYAYGNQPRVAAWNLARFAEALLPLLHEDPERAAAVASEALGEFGARFEAYWLSGMRAKLGLFTDEPGDAALAGSLLDWMAAREADFTNTFRALSAEPSLREASPPDEAFRAWSSLWEARLLRQGRSRAEAAELMRSRNPAVIPRNQRVEEALAAAEHSDLSVMENLLAALKDPFRDPPAGGKFREPGPRGYRTFCGT